MEDHDDLIESLNSALEIASRDRDRYWEELKEARLQVVHLQSILRDVDFALVNQPHLTRTEISQALNNSLDETNDLLSSVRPDK